MLSAPTHTPVPLTTGAPGPPRFGLIYADPPWRFQTWSYQSGGRRAPYPTMTTGDIGALPVSSLCADDCALFLWAIYPMLPDALAVMRAWGFTYKTCAFTWVKRNPSGSGFHMGQGYWTRSNPELCLLGTRGHPRRVSTGIANLVVAARREHSRKPEEVRERIVALCGDLPRAELFAREKASGWSVWGNEVESDFCLPPPACRI